MPAPKMRTAEGLLLLVKQDDPDTAVTLRMIRRLIATGELPHIDVGKKKLADYNKLMDYLKGEQAS